MKNGNLQEKIKGIHPTEEMVLERHAKITASQFVAAFRDVWISLGESEKKILSDAYSDSKAWTFHMIKGEKSLFKQIADRTYAGRDGIEYRSTETYTIDAIIADNSDLLGRPHQGYPTRIYAAIEHENGDHPEEEMWKLLWWRCPLKIIVFYDWSAESQEKNVGKMDWAKEKVNELSEMKNCVNKFLGPNTDTFADDSEYLLIVGQVRSRGDEPSWRYVLLDNHSSDTSLKYLAGPDLYPLQPNVAGNVNL